MNQSDRTFTTDGAWCFFADPRAVYYAGKHERTYVGWITSIGDIMIGYYDHLTDQIESFLIRAKLEQDDHANPTLYIDKQGYVTIFYSAHNGKEMFYRTTKRAEDLTSFGSEKILNTNTEGQKGYTYPTPIYLEKEHQLYLFWRGGDFNPSFSKSSDLGKDQWSQAQTLIKNTGHRPYTRFTSDGVDTIHFAFTDGHPNVQKHNSIYYVCYKDGSYYRADGSPIKEVAMLPLEMNEGDLVYDAHETGYKTWIWDIGINKDSSPVLVYAVFVSDDDHRYYYSCWRGGRWETNEITAAGPWFPETAEGVEETEPYYSGGIALDPRDPSNVYLSRIVAGYFEIEHWYTKDDGRSWSSRPITSNSAHNNVRPYISKSSNGEPALLLWMHGTYVHYTDYHTVLKLKMIGD